MPPKQPSKKQINQINRWLVKLKSHFLISLQGYLFFLENFGAEQLGSNACIAAPGRYRKIEEKKRNNSVKCAGRNSAILKSYGQKTKDSLTV